MPFITRINLKDNRQHILPNRENQTLSGITNFGVPFSALTSGPDPNNSGFTNSIINVISTFSGNTGTTIFNFGDPAMNIAQNSFSAITNITSGITQDSGNVFVGNNSQIIDGNLVYLDYTGVSFEISVSSITETSPGIYTGTVFSDEVYFLSAGTLDYTGRTIWVDVDGILRTNKFIMSNGAQPGYVLTSNSEGMGIWQPFSGSGGDTYITGFTVNENTYSISDNSGNTFNVTWTGNTSASCVSDFYTSNIHSCSPLHINPLDEGNIYFGSTALTVDIEGGNNNLYSKAKNVIISDNYHIPSYTALSSSIRGIFIGSNHTDNTGILTSNGDANGSSGIYFGNYSGTTLYNGRLVYYGTGYTRPGTPTTGLDFYRNKVVLKGSQGVDGVVINPISDNPNGTIWFEVDGNATGIMYSSNGYWGFGLNIDGTEMPSAHVQIGGTASTGTFKYIDGNQGGGKVLTSDSNGNATWQPISGSSGQTFWISGDSGNGSIKTNNNPNLYINANDSILASGTNNKISGSTIAYSSAIIGGDSNNILSNITSVFNSVVVGGELNTILGSTSTILGGINNYINSDINGSAIIGGFNNYMNVGVNRSVIIGGSNITATTSEIVYVPDLVIDGLTSTDPIATDANGKIVAGTSDRRLKKDIKPLSNGLDKIKKLQGVSFEYTEESNMGGGVRFGFIAQDVQKVLPDMVRTRAKGDGMLTLNYDEIIPWLVEAIKDITNGDVTIDNTKIHTESIVAEDSFIELNYNGNHKSSKDGGIYIKDGVTDGVNSFVKINENGKWVISPSLEVENLTLPNYTPSSTNDTRGDYGDVVWDENYLYIKTKSGWKRTGLETF